jgi:hypothetical protein
MYSTTEKLWEIAEKRKLTNEDEDGNAWNEDFVQYQFKDDPALDKRSTAQSISFSFWEGHNEYDVKWDYDRSSNTYLRTNGGAKHLDKDNDKQITSKNVVVLFMRESRANDGYEGNLHLLYGTKGSGRAIVFADGQKFDATWSKKDRVSRTKLTDSNGKEIKFNRGQIWFEILATGTSVVVK